MNKKLLFSTFAITIVIFLIIASCRIEFPQKTEANKSLWTEASTSESPAATQDSSSFLDLFKNLAKKLDPAVVNIYTTTIVKQQPFMFPFDFFEDDFFDDWFGIPRSPKDRQRQQPQQPRQREFKQQALGSGFIINEDGYILTNNHVVSGADEIKVKLLDDETEYSAKIVGKDEQTDMALIKIQNKKKLPILPLGDSEKLEVGEWVLAIGNPGGFGNTVTKGIVSSKGRSLEGLGLRHPYYNFIQTDAAINPGNSGGPLINTKGEVVGINTAILKNFQGIGFAIPINIAKDLLPQLKEGKVIRGWLGVGIQEITEEMRKKFKIPQDQNGVLVTQVFEGEPAHKAGIAAWDIIVEIDAKPIKNSKDLIQIIGSYEPGRKVNLKVLRNGDFKTVTVTITERKDEVAEKKPEENSKKDLGITVAQITKQLASDMDLPKDEGVVITAVEQNSVVAEANLRKGDIILDIDRKAIKTIKEFDKIVSEFKAGETVFIRVQRGVYTTFLTTLVIPKE